MKAFLLAIFALLTFSVLPAQKGSFSLLEKAQNYYNRYDRGHGKTLDTIRFARKECDAVFNAHPDLSRNFQAQLLRGRIYEALHEEEAYADSKFKGSKTGQSLYVAAARSYRAALELSVTGAEKTDAAKSCNDVEAGLRVEGSQFYEKEDFAGALLYFEEAIRLYPVQKQKAVQLLTSGEEFTQLVQAAALCAIKLKQYATAQQHLQSLIDNSTANGATYEMFYELYTAQGKRAEAEKKLNDGISRFPDYAGLVFTAINQLLQQNRISELPPLLKKAIALEPDNHALYHTLGNVYDNLMQRAAANGKTSEATANFTEAENWFKKATEKGPAQADYWYSAGAFYYNQAAMLNKKLTGPAITPQEEASVIREMRALFDKALPFFQKAESLAPSDGNTLIALKEIYARKEDATLYQEFSRRLKTVTEGGKIEKSYFK